MTDPTPAEPEAFYLSRWRLEIADGIDQARLKRTDHGRVTVRLFDDESGSRPVRAA
jgi:hypothetical protein